MVMAVLSTLYTLASIRTNIVLVFTFFNIAMAFIMLMAAYWVLGEGNMAAGGKLTIVSRPSRRLNAGRAAIYTNAHTWEGRWCIRLHVLYVWLVSLVLTYSRSAGFPVHPAAWRLEQKVSEYDGSPCSEGCSEGRCICTGEWNQGGLRLFTV